MNLTIKKAVKKDAKLRLALCGPAGSGKTFTSLTLGAELVKGTGGRIAYVDTEHGSASKYADLFDFDVIEPSDYDPRELIKFLRWAPANGYALVVIDSLSHYWMGKGGELEIVDASAKKSSSGNTFAAWKTVTPIHNELVDTIIASPVHILVAMRTKTEWVIEENERGKKMPRKIGMAPVMRDGIEFEFDVCGDLDQENTLVVTKSRCPELAGKVFNRPGEPMAATLRKWLSGAPVETPAETPAPIGADDLPTNLGGTYAAPANPAPERLAQARERIAQPVSTEKPWTTFKGMIERFGQMKELVGEALYYETLKSFNVEHANAFKSGDKALECYGILGDHERRILREKEAA